MAQQSNVNILITARNLASRVLNQARADVVGFGRGVRDAMFSIQGALAAAGITVALGSIVRGIFSANQEFQRLTAQLRTFTGSQDAANAKFKELQQLAIDLPFELRDITQSYINLRGAGIDATTEMLEAFSNVAVSAQGNIAELGEAIRAALTGEFERLKRFNIVARVDGEKLNLTYQGMTKTIDRSAKAVAGFLVQLGRNEFAGASARQMATLDGQISNLRDNFFKLATAIGEAGLTSSTAQMIGSLNELTAEVIRADSAVIKYTRTILAIGAALTQTVIAPLRLFLNAMTTLWHTGTLLHVALSIVMNRLLALPAHLSRNKNAVRELTDEYLALQNRGRVAIQALIQDGNDSFAALQNLGQSYRELYQTIDEGEQSARRARFEGRTQREQEIEQLRTNLQLGIDREKSERRLKELQMEIVKLANTRGDAEGRLGRQLATIAQIQVDLAEADRKGATSKKSLAEQLEDELDARLKLAELTPKNLSNLVALIDLERRLAAEIAKKNSGLKAEVENRTKLLEVQAAINEIFGKAPPETLGVGIDVQARARTRDQIGDRQKPPVPQGPVPQGGVLDQIGEAIGDVETLDQIMADMITGTIRGFGDAITEAFAALASGSISAGQAFKRAMLGALSAVAKGFAEFYLKQALAKFALRDFAAAAKLTAAAMGLFALAGALGGAGGGGGGGGGSGGAGSGPGSNDVDGAAKQDMYVIVEGGFLDMNDPRQAESFRRAFEQATGRRIIVLGSDGVPNG